MSAPRTLGRMLAVDLRFGAREMSGRFAAALLLMVVLVVLFRLLTVQNDGNFLELGFIDCLASLFGGMGEFDPQSGKTFNIPASWLCVCLMGAFVVLSYPTRNLESVGVKQCIAARGRWCWWLSKCIWTVTCAFLYWLLAVIVALAVSTPGALEEGLTLSPATTNLLGFFAAGNCAAYGGSQELLLFVAGIPFALSATYLVQLAVSVNVNPLAAFAVTATQLFYAAFYLSPLLPGNYLMLARSDLVIHNGVDAAWGIALSVAVGAAAVLVGGKVFARHDLLGKERYGQ